MIALDSNVVLYAELEPSTPKGSTAARLVKLAAGIAVLSAQALGEVLWVLRRSAPRENIVQIGKAYASAFQLVPTTADLLQHAAELSTEHDFQFWDALIWVASAEAGASFLLTEDLQDGFRYRGVQALNPFAESAWPALSQLFPELTR